jgi:hypothetical protein
MAEICTKPFGQKKGLVDQSGGKDSQTQHEGLGNGRIHEQPIPENQSREGCDMEQRGIEDGDLPPGE